MFLLNTLTLSTAFFPSFWYWKNFTNGAVTQSTYHTLGCRWSSLEVGAGARVRKPKWAGQEQGRFKVWSRASPGEMIAVSMGVEQTPAWYCCWV